VINIEKNPNKQAKEERIKKMLREVMATHELLAKNFFDVCLKKNGNLVFVDTLDFGLDCGE
jgi:hypothetical protein